jgi:hypothetical protein
VELESFETEVVLSEVVPSESEAEVEEGLGLRLWEESEELERVMLPHEAKTRVSQADRETTKTFFILDALQISGVSAPEVMGLVIRQDRFRHIDFDRWIRRCKQSARPRGWRSDGIGVVVVDFDPFN